MRKEIRKLRIEKEILLDALKVEKASAYFAQEMKWNSRQLHGECLAIPWLIYVQHYASVQTRMIIERLGKAWTSEKAWTSRTLNYRESLDIQNFKSLKNSILNQLKFQLQLCFRHKTCSDLANSRMHHLFWCFLPVNKQTRPTKINIHVR